ncbi:hypothetical protein CPB84DRAFT_1891293 [Gymnopilus junonius]|uniref:Uncharacterized protein n=1 Tax=Gymnopilus junonius TaxID=109634 RepID=A0A9P5NVQ2_GYMJU|nr:hypothetical protein CPB84DRAFT_1891293 [Gymnopilus junonius]
MPFKQEDVTDMKPLDVKEEESKNTTLDVSSRSLKVPAEGFKHTEMVQAPPSKPTRKEEGRVKVDLENGKAVLGQKLEQKPVDMKRIIKVEPTVKPEMFCKNEERVKSDLEGNKTTLNPEQVQHPSERVKVNLDESKSDFLPKCTVEAGNETSLEDIMHGRVECEEEELEMDPNDFSVNIAQESGDAQSVSSIVQEDEKVKQEVSASSTPSLQGILGVPKFEAEQKPEVRKTTERLGLLTVKFKEDEKPKIEFIENPDVKMTDVDPTLDSAFEGDALSDAIASDNIETAQEPVDMVEPSEPAILPNDPFDEAADIASHTQEQHHTELRIAALEVVHDEEREVIIIKDEPDAVEDTALLTLENSKKRKRMIVEVVVDTYANFLKRKKEDFEKIKKLKNPKIHGKKAEKMEISIQTVWDRTTAYRR